jgi:hypothetical protein
MPTQWKTCEGGEMTIHMRHIETNTFRIGFELIDSMFVTPLEGECRMMNEAWPNAEWCIIHRAGTGEIQITYKGSQSYSLALGAAENLQQALKRHSWWKEVQL